MNHIDPTDAEIAADVRHHVRCVKAGIKSSGSVFLIDGLWVIVGVDPSLIQSRGIEPMPCQTCKDHAPPVDGKPVYTCPTCLRYVARLTDSAPAPDFIAGPS